MTSWEIIKRCTWINFFGKKINGQSGREVWWMIRREKNLWHRSRHFIFLKDDMTRNTQSLRLRHLITCYLNLFFTLLTNGRNITCYLNPFVPPCCPQSFPSHPYQNLNGWQYCQIKDFLVRVIFTLPKLSLINQYHIFSFIFLDR